MSAVNSINQLIAARRVQQTLRKNPNDVEALLELAIMLGSLKKPDPDTRRKVLNKVLALDPLNERGRELLLQMDRAAMNVGYSTIEPVVPPARASRAPIPLSWNDPFEEPRLFRYSLPLQFFVYLFLAFAIYLGMAILQDHAWDALPGLVIILLLLMIPLWFVSAVLKIDSSGVQLSRLFGITRREVSWHDMESMKSSFLGQGIKIVDKEGARISISSQMRGYPAILEILRNMRPDLFGISADSHGDQASTDRQGVPFEETKVFQKSALTKYVPLLLLFVASLAFLCTLFSLQLLPAIVLIVGMIALWRFALHTPHTLIIQGNRLSTESFRKKREFTSQQIKDIRVVSTYIRRGLHKRKHIHLELFDGTAFALAGFSEGDDIMYGFLRHWWGGWLARHIKTFLI